MMTVIRTDPCGPAESGINTVRAYRMSEEGMTAPEGAGSLRRIRPDHSLRNVDGDRDLVGLDHHTETVATVLDADLDDPNTSYRDGPESAEKVRCRDRFGLPAYRHFCANCGSDINLSSTISVFPSPWIL